MTSNTITDTETFHFNICQEVPYERDAAYYYSAFVMKDTVPTGLKVTSVKILNEAGGNATGKFNVTTSGQTVTATAIDTSAGSFYNQEYTMQIFCKYDPSAGNSGPWKNQASVEVTRNGKTETKKSNETTTEIPFRKITTEVVNGTITPSDTKVKVGTDKKIDYSPKEGYFLTSVAVDGKEVDQAKYPSTYSFTNVQADHTIKVVYSPNPTKQVVDNKGSDINGKLRHPCNMYQTDICFDQKQRFCQGKRGVDMKKAAILILRFIMVPFRLVIHVMAAIAWLAVRLSSIIAGPVIALLGVLAVFCAAHQEWRNVVILLILGGAIYVAYFLAGNVLARAGSL